MTVLLITSEDGDKWLLADSEAEAHEWAKADLDEYHLKADGWMMDVGWDRDTYQLKREFVEDTGFDSWWIGCSAPADGKATAKCKQAFQYIYGHALASGRKEQSP